MSRSSVSMKDINMFIVCRLLIILLHMDTVIAFNGNWIQYHHPSQHVTRMSIDTINSIPYIYSKPVPTKRKLHDRYVLLYSGSISDISTSENDKNVSDDNNDDIDILLIYEMLETAKEAAIEAGNIIIKNLGCGSNMNNNNNNIIDTDETIQETEFIVKTTIKDIVTQYDTQTQSIIKSIIQTKYPTHIFLGEEDISGGAVASEEALQNSLQKCSTNKSFLWITDPIDGTANFACGLKLCAVTICVVYNNKPLIGVIYDPHTKELFYAIRTNGSFMTTYDENYTIQSTIQLDLTKSSNANNSIKDAIINAGCPADTNAFTTSIKGIVALNQYCRGIRMIACSALTTVWIASNRLTAHFGYDLSCWDLIAGALIISEANGIVTDINGTPYTLTTRNMLCSNGNTIVHNTILQILKDADAISYERS